MEPALGAAIPTLAMNDQALFAILLAAAGVGVVAIICGTLCSIVKTNARERSRREVAAYVAEGSMAPTDAERILKAEPPSETADA